ncbi:protein EVI2B [Alligator sinensis]|uniref:Protein EVI2B n=1 Tax=Alligator sinensis TaxID=38654 RepID=A0A1U8DLY7_ALLSI|nr:protein EVI2B [Alligator sinensis]XP_025066349.1 protein EVI2B [Alligator sinensis]
MPPVNGEEMEPRNDTSWIAAVVIGIILIAMMVAIVIILLCKCAKTQSLTNPNWAGRSPFADGQTPDVFVELDQATKRASVFSILPWIYNKTTHLSNDCHASEQSCDAPSCNTATLSLPPVQDGPRSPAHSNPVSPSSDINVPPSPVSEEQSPCNPPPNTIPSLPESPDMPLPPDWMQEFPEIHSSEISNGTENKLEAENPFPPPPDLTHQDENEPLPPPLPEEPLQIAEFAVEHTSCLP